VSEDRSVLSRHSRPPDAVLHYGPHSEHLVDVYWPAEGQAERPLVLLVHGGFWRPEYDRTHTGPMGEALAAAGWTVATIEYRRCPGDPDATMEDLRLAVAQVPGLVSRHNGNVLLLGHSAGGHLALWAAAQCNGPGLRGVVALAPVADLQMAHALALDQDAVAAFLGTEPHKRPDLDPIALQPQVPALLLHGEDDAIVRPALSAAYQQRHGSSTLIRLPGAGHFAVIDPLSTAWPEVLRGLDLLAGR
jgi:acetyl esterase/lipase